MKKNIVRRQVATVLTPGFEAVHPVLQRVYAARKVKDPEDIEKGLDRLLAFQSLRQIDKAVDLLVEALEKNQRILIVGDFDADGATSTALSVKALRFFGAKHVDFLVPNRFEYGYGLTPELVAAAKDFSPDLIMTVDNGIANHAGVDAAKALGIRVLITDHHLPAPTLPNADAIVNPNQYEDHFPSKCLAGVGVAFYLMLALRRRLLDIGWFAKKQIAEPNMSSLLDLVALGTVADLVPLDRNNRILVYHGLRRIRSGQCLPAIVALLEFSNRDFRKVVAADLGFVVAARLNAAGRLDDMSLGINCLLCEDSYEVRGMAQILDQLNHERRGIEQTMQAKALDVINNIGESLAQDLPKGMCLYDASWHQGVIGILASRIKDKFHRPVIVFAPGQDGEIKGSARSVDGLHIRDVLALIDAQHPELILKFGGHAMAAGLTIIENNFKKFATLFDEFVSLQISEAALQHTLMSDGELLQDELSMEMATLLRDAGPWGQGFPEPIFDDEFRLLEQRIVGDKHLKLKLAKGDKVLDGIAFFVDTAIWPNHRCTQVKVAYRLDINEFRERKNLQLIVEHLEAN